MNYLSYVITTIFYTFIAILFYFTFSNRYLSSQFEIYSKLSNTLIRTSLLSFDDNIKYGLNFLETNSVYDSTQEMFIKGSGLKNSSKEEIINELRLHYYIPFSQKESYEQRMSSLFEKNIQINTPVNSVDSDKEFYCPITFLSPDITPEFRNFLGVDICRAETYSSLLKDLDLKEEGEIVIEGRNILRTGEYIFDIAARNSNGIVIISVFIQKLIETFKKTLRESVEFDINPSVRIKFTDILNNNKVYTVYDFCSPECDYKGYYTSVDSITLYNKKITFEYFFERKVIFTSPMINIFILLGVVYLLSLGTFYIFFRLKESNNIVERYKYANEILGYINHEIRNPLNSIKGLITLVKYDLENPNFLDTEVLLSNLNTAESCCIIIGNIVNDILDIKKLQDNNIKIYKDIISIEKIKNDIEKATAFKRNEHQYIDFFIEEEDDLPQYIYTDPTKLLQILLNFIINSYKFTIEGYIKVKISKDDEDIIKFSVIDTGIGIKDEAKNKIFTLYPEIQDNSRLNKKGFGIGLYLCYKMSKIMDYDIGFTSEYGKGSEFFVKFKHNRHLQDDLVVTSS